MLGGVVVYSNEAKVALRGRPDGADRARTAPSRPRSPPRSPTARCARFGAELGIGITGIAGPGGGTPEKPVGTVCLSVADAVAGRRVDRTVQLPGDRAQVRDRTTTVALHMLRSLLLAELVSVRLFVALDLPAPALRALAAFRDAAADPVVWRPLDASTFHVTLAFLGHRDEADVARCVAALVRRAGRGAAARARAGAAAHARADRRARGSVGRAGPAAGGGERGARAGGRLRAGGAAVPAARDGRRGCARARGRRAASALPDRSRSASRGGPVVLYRSLLGRGGATYEPLWTTLAPG